MRKAFLRFSVLLLGIHGSGSLWGQAEVTTKEAPVAFQSGVNLVPVTVVVRDTRGQAVGTLGREDFQLSDNGKPQMISRFTLEKLSGQPNASPAAKPNAAPASAGEAPAAAPGGVPDRFTAYLFDDLHLSSSNLNATRDAARRQIDSSVNPLERTAIYSISGNPTQEFTADQDKLHAALATLSTKYETLTKLAQGTCPPMTYYMGDQIYNENDSNALNLTARNALICANLEPREFDSAVRMAQATARDAVLRGDKDTSSMLDALRNVVSRMASMPGQRTIVLISPGFPVFDRLREEETALIERAIKANVVIAALDARGLYTVTPGGDSSMPDVDSKTMAGLYSYAKTEAIIQSAVLSNLTSGTGGLLYEGKNDYNEGFARVAAAPEYLYVLGFSPLEMKLDGSYHNLKVTLKSGAAMTIQARTGYYAPTHSTNPADQAKQQIEEAFFSRDEIHDLPAVLQTQYFKSDDANVRLSATAEVDVKKLAFRKEGDRNRNDITVVTGLFDSDGNYVSGAQKIVEMRLLDETLAKHVGSGIAVKSSFAVHPGRYVVRMVVRDSEGQLMSAQSSLVDIP